MLDLSNLKANQITRNVFEVEGFYFCGVLDSAITQYNDQNSSSKFIIWLQDNFPKSVDLFANDGDDFKITISFIGYLDYIAYKVILGNKKQNTITLQLFGQGVPTNTPKISCVDYAQDLAKFLSECGYKVYTFIEKY